MWPSASAATGFGKFLACRLPGMKASRFWRSVMTELKNWGVQDILIASVDGLKGFPEAITAAFPETTVQTCIVHLVRHSLNFVRRENSVPHCFLILLTRKNGKAVAADLREIYSAATADQAAVVLDAFEEKWAGKYASVAPAWRRAWNAVIPFFAFDPALRRSGRSSKRRTPSRA